MLPSLNCKPTTRPELAPAANPGVLVDEAGQGQLCVPAPGALPRRRDRASLRGMPTLSADALLVIAQWRCRPDAALHMSHDVCVPAGQISDHTMIPAIEEVSEAGLTENAWEGLRLTHAGRGCR